MPDLGNYATEVLLAYGVSIALLVVIVVASWRSARRSVVKLAAAEEAKDA